MEQQTTRTHLIESMSQLLAGIAAAAGIALFFQPSRAFAADEPKPAAQPPPAKPQSPPPSDDDLLSDEEPPEKPAPPPPATPPAPAPESAVTDPHAAVFAAADYPSAAQCAACHQTIYDEWSSSNHAYASISPMFHKFEQTISQLASGTVGYFCMRCHGTVGTALKEPREMPLWDRSLVSREGVTCITCHRVDEQFAKVNGERRVVPGDINQPVYGGIGGDGVAEVVSKKDFYKVKPSASDTGPGMKIHAEGIKFAQISTSEFCLSCHQVAVHPGIKLEVVWDQYRASPAFKQGVVCQECHMGLVPGVVSGYATGPAARINGKVVNDNRKHANHSFYGPGYPIAHPGLFPHNPANDQFTPQRWLKFDFRAGWGSDEFEKKVSSGQVKVTFPAEWDSIDDRNTAWSVVQENLKKLQAKRELRQKVMENGSRIDGPFFDSSPAVGTSLKFHYLITNINPGHNLPSGSLGAQPEIWIDVALINPQGKRVWESGYVDSHGDMADFHSLDVEAGTIAADQQLVNLQTKFLTQNVKGTDREMYLPVPFDQDQLPFIRPAATPNSVMNHPPTIRMEGRSIPPLGDREAKYKVPASAMSAPGTYRLAFRMRSRAEPIYFMKFCDATIEMEQSMNEWMIDIHPYTVQFEVK